MRTRTLEPSLSTLIKQADTVFSEFIRLRDSRGGMVKCFICGYAMPWRQSQNMHFIDRDQMPTRYDEMNCHAGCEECNCFDTQHQERYEAKLLEILTPEGLEHLKQKSRGLQKFMKYEVLEIIETYKAKILELRSQILPGNSG